MSARTCPLGLDADVAARAIAGELPADEWAAFEAHVEACEACARSARVLHRARGVWRRTIERDDAFGLHAREARLASAARVPRVRSGALGAMALGAAAAAIVVVARLAIAPPGDARVPPVVATSTVVPPAPPLAAPSASAAQPRDAPTAVITARACRSCAHPIDPGTVLARDDGAVDVAPGSTLLLGWSLRADDPTSTVEVDGPAMVAAADGSAGPAIVVARGVARARVDEPRELRTELARTIADHGAWRVDARADRTRVEATAGSVTVVPLGDAGAPIVLRAGESIDVLRDGRAIRVAAPIAAPSRGDREPELWERSDEALRRGDRAATESALRALLETRPASPLRDRASLRLAELELARGDRPGAGARLESLLGARDPSIAADAALLLARAQPTASLRAGVWADYLATSPPSPYREQASIERARALLDRGDVTGARAIVAELEAAPSLPDVVRAPLARLRDRLATGR